MRNMPEFILTRDDARNAWGRSGLSFSDITEGDIMVLLMMCNQEVKISNENGETSVNTMHMSKKIDLKKKSNGSMVTCCLYINSHYFTQREAITFASSGFIGFCGWADDGNTQPIIRAFMRWVQYLQGDIPPKARKTDE